MFTLVHSIFLSSTDFKIRPCSASKSVTPGPEAPGRFSTANLIASSLFSTGIKIGVSLYVSNVAQEEIFSCGCFLSKTDTAVILIVPV